MKTFLLYFNAGLIANILGISSASFLFRIMDLDYLTSTLIGMLGAILLNFFLNFKMTFKVESFKYFLLFKFAIYNLFMILANLTLVLIFHGYLFVSYEVSLIFSIMILFIAGFFISKFFIFIWKKRERFLLTSPIFQAKNWTI